jgi:beta-N-acetylhexosaminidase
LLLSDSFLKSAILRDSAGFLARHGESEVGMPIRIEELGQLFIIGFHGSSADVELRNILRTCHPGGAILFKRNLQNPEQISALTAELQAILPKNPLMLCVDQEGGRVWRMPREFTFFPEAALIGRIGKETLARSVARVIAVELSAVGIHCNFSPVLDLNTRPSNPVIGDRSLGTDPLQVARLARAILLGFRENGISGCGKHFPGHGDTELDSHLELPTVHHDQERLEAVELAPYRWLLKDHKNPLEMIMTAHLMVPCLDPIRPATLSHTVLTGLLRQRLGFGGLIVTDDLEMGAISETYSPQQAALLALKAGADLLLYCHTPSHLPACLETVRRALDKGEISASRIRRSLARIRRFKKNLFRRFPSSKARQSLYPRIGCPEHRIVADWAFSLRDSENGDA